MSEARTISLFFMSTYSVPAYTHLTHLSSEWAPEAGAIITLVFLLRETGHQKGKQPAQGHMGTSRLPVSLLKENMLSHQ